MRQLGEEPEVVLVFLENPGGNWIPYRCRVSGLIRFTMEGAACKARWLIGQGWAISVKAVTEAGEVASWEQSIDGRVGRTR